MRPRRQKAAHGSLEPSESSSSWEAAGQQQLGWRGAADDEAAVVERYQQALRDARRATRRLEGGTQEDGEGGCEELDKICQKLREIKFKDTRTQIKEELNPERFLPSDRSYFSYLGSLTTPPLLECVTWIIFKQPIKATEEQVGGGT